MSLRSARLSPCIFLRKKEEMERDVMWLVWVTNVKWAAQMVQCGRAWSEDESVSSNGSREGNEGNDALHVMGLYGLGDKISFS